ncbi:MAG: tRNA lysidine(34) synthetase TilS [Acidocella sp.]|nr:tRNA lysidine(34) synthetase TilS [Acidocella sp.]
MFLTLAETPGPGAALAAALTTRFAIAMDRLGPYPNRPVIAVAVSGGADSMAACLLADHWARQRGGHVRAFIVDHGLRPASATDAATTAQSLSQRHIPSRVLTLSGLPTGAGLQAQARRARHGALGAAASASGCLHLVLGHHAADQAETLAMRALRGPGGAAGIATFSARAAIVLLRPLLAESPATLRAYLRQHGVTWVEDPSNLDPRFERARLRLAGVPPRAPTQGERSAHETATFLARHTTIRPEGFALIHVNFAPPAALGALLRTIGGADYAPASRSIASLCMELRPATLGGVRLMQAGRLDVLAAQRHDGLAAQRRGTGWLLVRELASCRPDIAATSGAIWDRRFRLAQSAPPGWRFGALGTDARQFRGHCGLPSAVLRAMPCLRGPNGEVSFPVATQFMPPQPLSSASFMT